MKQGNHGWTTTRRCMKNALITETSIATWAKFKNRVDQLTNGLMRPGLMKGDVVAVQLPNIPEFMIAHVAISAFGGVMQTIPCLTVKRILNFS